MKKLKAILALMLALVMVFALAACGAKDDGKVDDTAEPSTSPSDSAQPSDSADPSDDASDFPAYTIGFTSHGAGVWIIDLCRLSVQHYVQDVLGMQFQSVAANFSSEQMVKDVQNSVSAGQDGHMYTNTWGTIMQSCSEIFEQSQTPWINYDQVISADMIDIARENPYFVGTIGSDAYNAGYLVGQQAAEDGYRAAAMIGGAIGDSVVDARLQGFTDAFEAGGGKVIAEARCTDPSEAQQKGDDLIAAHGTEIDCFFGQNADFAYGVLNALDSYDIEGVYPYTAEPDAACLEMIRNGEMSANTPTGSIASALSAAMLINYLDGCKMVDENGEAPYLDTIPVWMVTPDRADVYQEFYIDGFAWTDDSYKEMLYRYNPDITFEQFSEMVANVDYDFLTSQAG